MRNMHIISNLGARKVVGLPRNFQHSGTLEGIKSEFCINVQYFFIERVVSWVGHCFRHPSHPISKLLSLPLDGRLADLRSRGTETPLSFSALAFWNRLVDVGLDVAFPSSGRPAVRGSSGAVIRWGEGWLGPIRDGGVGWDFGTDDSQRSTDVYRFWSSFSKSRVMSPCLHWRIHV